MNDAKAYDAIIIGVGQAGNPLASALVQAGWKVAVVERKHVGGTCVNVGCTPTKTMVASARVAYLARRGADFGVRTSDVAVDLSAVRQRKQQIVDDSRNRIQRRMETTQGIDFWMGEASFVSPDTVRIRPDQGEEVLVRAPKIFINTGARPSIPPLAGLDEIPYLNSTTIMELDELPAHLLVLGGGYIGLEFGQMFRRFGAQVTIIHRGGQLLSREDEDIASAVADILREDGIDVLLNTKALRVGKADAQPNQRRIRLVVDSAEGERTLVGSHLLVATGRQPNIESLNLAAAGIATDDRGYIRVNARLETNVPGIYALGDVNGGPAFTHISYDDFRIIRTNLLDGSNASTDGRLVPYTVFLDPQLGRIGMSEAEAQNMGRQVRVAKMPMAHVARAIEIGETRGFIKALVDAESEQLLGAAVLGVEGGELASQFQIAMMGKLRYTALRDAILPHPGLAEAWNNLFARL